MSKDAAVPPSSERGDGVMRLIGIDPGLRQTGWGVLAVQDNRLRHIANGVVVSNAKLSLAERLVQLHEGLAEIIQR